MTESNSIPRPAVSGIAFDIGHTQMEGFTTVLLKMRCEIVNPSGTVSKASVSASSELIVANSFQEWTKKGIVGRGVLIDYYSYAVDEGIPLEPWSFHQISVDEIVKIAEQKAITFQTGDILFLRTGTCSPPFSTHSS